MSFVHENSGISYSLSCDQERHKHHIYARKINFSIDYRLTVVPPPRLDPVESLDSGRDEIDSLRSAKFGQSLLALVCPTAPQLEHLY